MTTWGANVLYTLGIAPGATEAQLQGGYVQALNPAVLNGVAVVGRNK